MKSYEILAPAGSIEQLKMAVNNGCDAVYLGLDKFNARMKAENFTADNLSYWVDFCHLYGVKVYVAINTSLKNVEFRQAVETLKVVYFSNADGVILTDLALIEIAGKLSKPFDVVASTQLNVHDKEGATFLKNLGADTVVCARECSFDDIKDIASTGVKVETFIHGALCVCQSGQCLFSSIVGGNSGNRGLCAQPCRKKYVADGKQGYFLSPRDMYGLDVAKRLVESGATVFKIEGRNRRSEYSGLTSRVYSKAFANNFRYTQQDKVALAEMYNRGGFADIAYLNGNNDNVIYSATQNHIGVEVGKVKGKGFIATREIAKGDGLKVLSAGKEVCGGIAMGSGIGFVPADFGGKVCDDMTVCRTTSVALCNDVANAKRTLDVTFELVAFAGSSAKITAKCGNVTVIAESNFDVPQAINQPLDSQQISEQLSKTGNSYFTITNIVSKIDNIFLSKGQLNSLRRQVLDKLTDAIVEEYNARFANRKGFNFVDVPLVSERRAYPCIAVTCVNAGQVNKRTDADYVIYKPEILSVKSLASLNKFVYLDLPSFADLRYLSDIVTQGNAGIVCHNVGQVQFARDNNLRYIAGSGLNLFNDFIASVFYDADTFVYSHELTLAEISAFKIQCGLIFVDGSLTLMKVVHCPYKAVKNCDCSNCAYDGKLQYVDELGNSFKIVRRRDCRCTFEVVNGKKLSAISKLSKAGRYLVDYDEKVISHYVCLNNGQIDNYVEQQPYTKGRLFNKIN